MEYVCVYVRKENHRFRLQNKEGGNNAKDVGGMLTGGNNKSWKQIYQPYVEIVLTGACAEALQQRRFSGRK